ncbi:MAG: prolyl oligopeptidase family serine peptidase, partial [Longimicrobiales bacterium]
MTAMLGRIISTRRAFVTAALLCTVPLGMATPANAQDPYKNPPQNVLDILDAPATPGVQVSPNNQWLLLIDRTNMPSIAQVAEPMLRLAGYRVNPATNGPHGPIRNRGLRVKNIATGVERVIRTPAGGAFLTVGWSPDNQQFAFTNSTPTGIELWVADVATGVARKVTSASLNTLTPGCVWMPDGARALCKFVPAGRPMTPPDSRVPTGPAIQESSPGRSSVIRTYQDLLQNPRDEALFEYYFTSQMAIVDMKTGALSNVGKPGIYLGTSRSPDGQYLLVTRLNKPYSYLVPARLFPQTVEVWNMRGDVVRTVVDVPLQDNLPAQWVRTGPRNVAWRPGQPATLYWVEARDGGDPKAKAATRDRVVSLKAPFKGEPAEIAQTKERFAGMQWGENVALISDYDNPRRWARTWLFNPDAPATPWKLLWDMSVEDVYHNPGDPLSRDTPLGDLLIQNADFLFLSGAGATAEGDRPFLDRLDIRTGQSERIWRSDVSGYEEITALIGNDGRKFLTMAESPKNPPNVQLHDLTANTVVALTAFKDPAPQLTGIRKQLVKYTRKDGVPLSGTLYLPPDYKEGTKLPVFVWAYPQEFQDAAMAAQTRSDANLFTQIGGASHLFLLTQGYAVFDGPGMPIIGGDTANNTYIQQLVASAEAAVDKIVDMGIADRDRIGVGGHSYGAFMTANLLAHSDLFRAGIARSGAYNRSLTPFGFQNEERTFWEVPNLYAEMSPFWNAHKINEPLLMIHGEADNNMGTFPMQSVATGRDGAVKRFT